MTGTGFSARFVLRLAGISYRQLDYWDKTRLVGSSLRKAAGRGSRRVYSFEDLVALRAVAKLRQAGISIQSIRRALTYLKEHADKPLVTLQFIPDGKRVLVRTRDPALHIDATAQGQAVITITIPMAPITRDLQREVAELSAPRTLDLRVRGHLYRVVLTPDLEVGGYTITVPEIPGCISEADTTVEARRQAREAIELCLEVSSETGPAPKGRRALHTR